MPRKRKAEETTEDEDATPRKTRRSAKETDTVQVSSPAQQTPSRSILKRTPSKANGLKAVEATPSSLRKVLFSTPAQPEDAEEEDNEETPRATRNDRSARRKSQRTLQKNITEISDSEDEQDARDEAIASAILGEDEEGEEDEAEADPSSAPDTPSKTPRLRGRPKGRRRERTPSPPPPDLPPHELYFFQNRAGANKTSANTLPSHLLLNHDDYFTQINAYKDPHAEDIQWLQSLHKRAFDQWMFELEAGFNLCLYGYGSKRTLTADFATHLHHQFPGEEIPTIIIVNGYVPNLTMRDILTTISKEILPSSTKLPAQPPALLSLLLESLTSNPPKQLLTLIINSLDHAQLRKTSTQTLLARLASHPNISLISTCDTPNFPLLWDTTLTTQFNFLYHDATTFQPYTAEIEVVEEVNALLGRSSRRLGGKDGVGYVLKSLPENARSLFRILVAEQLALAHEVGGDVRMAVDDGSDEEEDLLGVEDEEEAAAEQETPSKRGRRRKKQTKATPKKKAAAVVAPVIGVEYRTLYHKAVEEFVCSSEVNFRTLLKEFHDHQMIESKKDALGTERLLAPFRTEELEGILEELV